MTFMERVKYVWERVMHTRSVYPIFYGLAVGGIAGFSLGAWWF